MVTLLMRSFARKENGVHVVREIVKDQFEPARARKNALVHTIHHVFGRTPVRETVEPEVRAELPVHESKIECVRPEADT
jgi:hypothetical protein